MALIQPIGLSEPDTEPPGGAPPSGEARTPKSDDGAVHRDQGRQSGLPAVLPDGRFLRDVLRRRRDRLARARHRADQARQASGPRHPDVRRAGGARRRISASPDRARPPRRGLRTDRGPGRGEEARLQERGAARRRAAGDARHADRRHAARCQAQQLSAGDRAGAAVVGRRGKPLRSRLDRHLDRRVPYRRERPRFAHRRDRAAGAERDHRVRRAVRRCRPGADLAHAAGGDAADPRRVRRRHRRAAADVVLCRGDQRSLRRADAAGGHRRRRLRDLRRAHPARPAPAAVAAVARKRRRLHRHRPGHPQQSRIDPHARRRAARLAA